MPSPLSLHSRSGMKMLFHLSIVQIKMWFLPRSFVLGKQSSNSLSFHGSEPLLYFFLNNYCMSTGLDDKVVFVLNIYISFNYFRFS
ncbi:hypothetical protein C7M20_00474 [Bacillus velezensis]|nr:hypothetical protein C7M19_02748 [Bacillus velezensis]QHK09378.1 hypothetical protein C7M20_00474 [Bacillus velezensis]